MPSKPVAKKPIPDKPQAVKPAQKNVVQKKPAPDKAKGLRLFQKKPAPDRLNSNKGTKSLIGFFATFYS
jgi:hypothetical protein